uniref:SUMO-activating enzyme subunit n=1 Tax=Angiostrongylus cantonensis TaxID=6313 RepID=A0A158P8S8_ANGCA
MDTIDVSNLNRQFLFRREHVGRSKAEVAAEAIHQLCPSVKITFDLDNISSTKFNIPFFQQFSLVMNALDNRAARNHVNRMCHAAKVPLIESGSAGYFGQVKPIVRDLTACYECDPRPEQEKTYPGCTIRNTPSEHIHCTVWSKHAFNQLFGELDVDADISPDFTDKGVGAVAISDVDGAVVGPMEEGQEENKSNGVASSSDKRITFMKQMSTREWAETVKYDPEKIFDKLFHTDISYLLRLKGLWCERRPPVPIRKADIVTACASSSAASNASSSTCDDMNKVWSLAECAEIFCECVVALSRRKNEDTVLHWDKDDEVAMRFVAASANIRASIFGIPCKSLFEIKSMAGNIVPAIATTNAIVAGMVVVEAAKIIAGNFDKLRCVFTVSAPNTRGKILVDHPPFPSKPNCFVCSDKRECFVRVNPEQMTVKALKDKILKGALNMVEPDVIDVTTSRVIISSDEDETSDIESKTLSEVSIRNGSMLLCDDFRQQLEFKIILSECSTMNGDEFEVC